MQALRQQAPQAKIEVLVPDFKGLRENVDRVLEQSPAVFNHNLETVPRLYPTVRPQADYERSLRVLAWAATRGGAMVKTGLMVGLGEAPEEVFAVLEDAVRAGVSVVTIGQYLRPSAHHLPVVEYISPRVFADYARYGRLLGLAVYAAPFVRSSYRAGETFAELGAEQSGLQYEREQTHDEQGREVLPGPGPGGIQ